MISLNSSFIRKKLHGKRISPSFLPQRYKKSVGWRQWFLRLSEENKSITWFRTTFCRLQGCFLRHPISWSGPPIKPGRSLFSINLLSRTGMQGTFDKERPIEYAERSYGITHFRKHLLILRIINIDPVCGVRNSLLNISIPESEQFKARRRPIFGASQPDDDSDGMGENS